MPYRTNELEWQIEREHVTMIKLGDKGLLEQIMLDNDPKEARVFVGRWDFTIDP